MTIKLKFLNTIYIVGSKTTPDKWKVAKNDETI